MILKDCEIWFLKADPKRPNARFNKDNPTWECQIRTTDKAIKKAWEDAGLPVKAIVPDDGPTYFRVNLKKKSIKEDGTAASPVKVVDGKLQDIDPNTVGNGSIANIRLFQYEFPTKGPGAGKASVLMGVQVTKLVQFTPRARDDEFQETDMEVIPAAEAESDRDPAAF